MFDLAPCTDAARIDRAPIGRHNIGCALLTFERQKAGVICDVPLTAKLRTVIARPSLNMRCKPYAPEGLGRLFRNAAVAVGMKARLHGLRQVFCACRAEQGKSAHQVAALAGHMTLGEVERHTRAADHQPIVGLVVKGG
ncbi:hypothetical protein [Paracoccus marinaquae]|uniref:Phage integrase family protein n=1 Tax=Paracoccus marinaquae TaxID=2841926 RepID=A0ABS6ADV0_9RHOB|nr:hypothetical protein [Paracoccus marinaquae]MBU3028768.1 hypothetical protein [Paracoccus marinaquae]